MLVQMHGWQGARRRIYCIGHTGKKIIDGENLSKIIVESTQAQSRRGPPQWTRARMIRERRRAPRPNNLNAVHELSYLQPHRHPDLHRYNADMNLRDSVSKPFKKLGRRLAKDSRKQGEGPGRGHDTEGSETGQSSRLHLEAEDAVESAPGQEGNDGEVKNIVQVAPPTSAPLIDNGKPNSERTKSFLFLSPNRFSSERSGFYNYRSCPRGSFSQQERTEHRRKNKSNWKSTAFATAGLFLRGVRDSADAFGPLKSVAGGLCFILENSEVRPLFHAKHLHRLEAFQRTKANTQAIESLAPRIKALYVSLCTSTSRGDPREQERRVKLGQ